MASLAHSIVGAAADAFKAQCLENTYRVELLMDLGPFNSVVNFAITPMAQHLLILYSGAEFKIQRGDKEGFDTIVNMVFSDWEEHVHSDSALVAPVVEGDTEGASIRIYKQGKKIRSISLRENLSDMRAVIRDCLKPLRYLN